MANRLKVLFLCAGNTCRSPVAEGLARARFGAGGVEFVSAGLAAWRGQAASQGSIAVAAEAGVDLGPHRAQPLDAAALGGVDWVIAMTRAQAQEALSRFPDSSARVALLGLPGVDLRRDPGATGGEEVSDPYGCALGGYHAMAGQIGRLLEGWREIFTSGGEAR